MLSDKERLDKILSHYGVEKQSLQTCEECGEFIQAVSKLVRGVTSERISNLIEEISDMYIMIGQMMIAYNIDLEEVEKTVDKKIARQLDRIDKEATCHYFD